jgi:hypothetical protein
VPLAGITPGAHRLRFEVAGDTPVYANVVFRRLTRLAEGESRTADGPLRMERTYALVRGGRATDGTARFEETALKDGEAVPAGSLVRVHVRVAGWPKDRDVSHLIVEDPLPGGFRLVEEEGVGSGDTEGGSYYTFEGRDDRAIGYYRYCWGKTLEFDYLLRAEVPGTYHVLPGRLWGMYAPWLLEGGEMRLGVRP